MAVRILWQSNAPWANTGYGVQANSLIPRILEMPECEDMAIFCYYGIQGAKTRQRVGIGRGINKFKWVDCYPLRNEMWGNDVVQDHALDFKADVVISLMDIWVLADDYGTRGYRWLPYMPIDMDPPPPPVLRKMKQSFLPLVYSQFAKRWCDRLGIEAAYVPLGVETKLYKPYRPHDKREAKELLGFPRDCFLYGIVAANKGFPSRKGFGELFEAFATIRQRHVDARLYVHALFTQEYGGLQLREMAEAYDILPWVHFVDPYKFHVGVNTDTMNMIYNAMDTFVLPSHGEGFGVPLVEAQAAGTPVITTDYTSMTELCGAGWTVPIVQKEYMPLQSWYAYPSVGSVVEAMEMAYHKAGDAKIREQARAFALNYDWDHLVETTWGPLVRRLSEEVTPRTYVLD
jgi:glycosyltransferase involved in cell wall biosynthesis